MRWLFLVALGVSANTASAQSAIPVGTGNIAHDLLAGYSPRERNQAVDRMLRSLGHDTCDVVETAFFEYHEAIAAIWLASCRDGRRYVMHLLDREDGAMAVFDCHETPAIRAYCDKR